MIDVDRVAHDEIVFGIREIAAGKVDIVAHLGRRERFAGLGEGGEGVIEARERGSGEKSPGLQFFQ